MRRWTCSPSHHELDAAPLELLASPLELLRGPLASPLVLLASPLELLASPLELLPIAAVRAFSQLLVRQLTKAKDHLVSARDPNDSPEQHSR